MPLNWNVYMDCFGCTLEDWLKKEYPHRENDALLRELSSQGVTGVTKNALRKLAQRKGIKKECCLDSKLLLPDKPYEGEFNWREVISAAQTLKRARQALDYSEETPLPIIIETHVPIVVTFSADWHVGSEATDYKAWVEDVDYILKTDNLFLAVIGDEYDNFRSFSSVAAVIQQLIPPDLQLQVIEDITREFVEHNKLLFTTWSNHVDSFDERVLGQAAIASLRRTQGVPHLGGLGVVRLVLRKDAKDSGQLYTIAATHKPVYGSHLRAAHGAMKLYQQYFPADICVTAHNHQPAHEEYIHYDVARRMYGDTGFGGTSWLISCSSYKSEESNSWAARKYGRGNLKRESAVLWPDEHRIEVFDSISAAVDRAQSLV